MIALTVEEVAHALGAVVRGPGPTAVLVADLVVDSRLVRPGSLFVALPGEHADGHDFVARACNDGAVAALTAREVPIARGVCLVVADPLAAMGRLARYVVDIRAADGLRVAAITGSQGKTSTKDLLAAVLERVGPTVAPHGNLNNEIGVPLTATRITEKTRFLVAEMGARGVGQVRYLCSLTPPQVSVVLNVGYAHLGEFGSRAAIAEAKGEIVEALRPDGVAVLNSDDPRVWAMASRTWAPVLAFSARSEPVHAWAVWATAIVSDALGRCGFALHLKSSGNSHGQVNAQLHRQVKVQLKVSGRHQVGNALAAAGAATALGLSLDQIAAGLTAAEPRSRSRMELHERDDAVLVVNDAYNANPDSCKAALETLAELGRSRRADFPESSTWAVLGDMLELGDAAASEHRAVGRHLAEAGVGHLVAVGVHASDILGGAVVAGLGPEHAVALADKSTAAQRILRFLRPGDVVLVKGSRGLALDTVAEEIWTASGHSDHDRPDDDRSEDPA